MNKGGRPEKNVKEYKLEQDVVQLLVKKKDTSARSSLLLLTLWALV